MLTGPRDILGTFLLPEMSKHCQPKTNQPPKCDNFCGNQPYPVASASTAPHALCDMVFWKYGSIRTHPQQLTLREPAYLSISKDEEAYPPLWNFIISDELYFFSRRNGIISWGKKHTALFQTHNWEKSSFFQHARTSIRTVIRKYVRGGAQ